MSISKKHIKLICLLLFIVGVGSVIQYKYLNEFPSHTHAWAQADRYAIANRFLENGFNFFKPETYVLNHQFPDNFKSPSNNSITAVDFPIHDYIVSLIMYITKTYEPFIFRLYMLLWSFLGLFYLGKISQEITKSYFKATLVLIIAMTSPIFCYYQAGFLPTIPTLSCIIIGYFYHLKYLKGNIKKHFIISLSFLTLGTLTRTTFIIPFIALTSIHILYQIKTSSLKRSNIIGYVISYASIFTYMIHNAYLRKQYGSMFLSYLVPADNFSDFLSIVYTTIETWGLSFFSLANYLTFLILIILAIIFRNRFTFNHIDKFYLKTIYLSSLGLLAFSIGMALQFPVHDYYLIDTYFFPLLLLITFLLKKVPTPRFKLLSIALITLFTIPLTLNTISFQESRREVAPWDNLNKSINRFMGSDKLLNSLDISTDSKILVFDIPAPNIPFLLMNRKGYMLWSIDTNSFKKAINTWDYDYLVIENKYFLSELSKRKLLDLKSFKKIGGNKELSVLKRTNSPSNLTNIDFYDKKSVLPFFNISTGFEKISSLTKFKTVTVTDSISYSGQSCYSLNCNSSYGLTFQTSDHINSLSLKDNLVSISGNFYSSNSGNVQLIVSTDTPEKNISYTGYKLNDLLKKKSQWEPIEIILTIPELAPEGRINIYLHNPTQNCTNLYIDNLNISLY